MRLVLNMPRSVGRATADRWSMVAHWVGGSHVHWVGPRMKVCTAVSPCDDWTSVPEYVR